jgi:DNA-binding transcriptional regulator YdaS (Cro superfamily)
MNTLRQFLKQLTPDEQVEFARQCGTSIGYIRKAMSINQRFSAELCIQFEQFSQGEIRCEDLRPDINWAVIRGHCPEQQAA